MRMAGAPNMKKRAFDPSSFMGMMPGMMMMMPNPAGGFSPMGPLFVPGSSPNQGMPMMNKSGQIREGDWTCPACSTFNYAFRSACMKCNGAKPPISETLEADPGAKRRKVQGEGMWNPQGMTDPSAMGGFLAAAMQGPSGMGMAMPQMGNMGNVGTMGNVGNMGHMGNMPNMANMPNMGNMGNMGNLAAMGGLHSPAW